MTTDSCGMTEKLLKVLMCPNTLHLGVQQGVENLNFYSFYMPICVCKFNNLHWNRFPTILQHEVITMASRQVDFFQP